MQLSSFIDSKLQRLISIMLTDGVQPGDLADNIFIDCYKSISYMKIDGTIVGELIFEETGEDGKRDVILRYYYDQDKKVTRIEQEIGGVWEVEWDREIAQKSLIQDIVDLLKVYSSEEVERFTETLPDLLKKYILECNIQVA